MSQIADSLGIRQTGVGLWIAGRTESARIAEAAQQKARELLKLEAKAARTPPVRATREPAAPAA